ncbi:hypothetical protein EBU95_20795 [bacterium]|nr:hypothetical protein [bacterium]
MLFDDITIKIAKTIQGMLKLNENIDLAAADIHTAWMGRNPKADWNAAQHVSYEELPEDEKEKDRAHIRTIERIKSEHKLDPANPENHEAIINHFGSSAHEDWRRGFEAKNGAGAARMKKTADGEVNINVPWKELHADFKKENIEAAKAAIAAYNKHMK